MLQRLVWLASVFASPLVASTNSAQQATDTRVPDWLKDTALAKAECLNGDPDQCRRVSLAFERACDSPVAARGDPASVQVSDCLTRAAVWRDLGIFTAAAASPCLAPTSPACKDFQFRIARLKQNATKALNVAVGQFGQLATTMQEGLADAIQYQWIDHVARTASLTDANKHTFGPIHWADDPRWAVVEAPPSTNHAESKRIGYLAPDGIAWGARVRCRYDTRTGAGAVTPQTNPPSNPVGAEPVGTPITIDIFTCDFEQFGPSGSHYDGGIRFLDWDLQPWEATMVPPTSFPGRPRFKLRRCSSSTVC
jgi:hypothetical protein